MYKILCDGDILCSSRVDSLAVISPQLKIEVNKAGTFSFTMPPSHSFYEKVKERTSLIEVWQDDELLFEGFPISVKVDFYKQKTIDCEGVFSFFNDSMQRPINYNGIDVPELLQNYIANHNAQTDSFKHFAIGIVTVHDPNNSVYCFSNYDSTMKCLQEDLVEDYGGYFRTRKDNGIRYLDYLAESPRTNTQTIRIGKNLLDFTTSVDSADIATVIIPLGEVIEDEQDVPGLEKRVNIKSVNDGNDWLESTTAANNFGRIEKTVQFDKVTSPGVLMERGRKWLNDEQFEKMVISATAFDLSIADDTFQSFKLLDLVRVVSEPHGLDRYFLISSLEYDLNEPSNNKLVLGIETQFSLSSQNSKIQVATEEMFKELPNTVLDRAKSNASALIRSSGAGFVTFDYDDDMVIRQILIMDTNDKETATKVWRWNQNGLGYSSTGYDGEYGLAMTIDGSIVADFMNTGTLNAELVDIINLKAQNIYVNSTTSIVDQFNSIDGQLEDLQGQIDGAIGIYYTEETPTLLNYPAWDFTYNIPVNNTVQLRDDLPFEYTEEGYRKNRAALTYNTVNGLSYRFTYDKDNERWYWMEISNTETGLILQRLSDVEITTDHLESTYTEVRADVTSQGIAITNAQSQISQQATQISLKVSSNGVISAINQTSESVKIDASKINLNGYVTVTNLSTVGQTTINGGNITTGTIDASDVKVINIDADNIKSGTINGIQITGSKITSDNKTDPNKIVLDNGRLEIHNRSGRIGGLNSFGSTGTQYNSVALFADSTSDGIGLYVPDGRGTYKIAHFINNGRNPSGRTELNIFYGDARFVDQNLSISSLTKIGAYEYTSAGNTSALSGSWTTLASLTLDAGKWMIFGKAFVYAGGGATYLTISTSYNSSGECTSSAGGVNANVGMNVAWPMYLDSRKTIYLNGEQTSGSSQNFYTIGFRAMRII